MRLLAIAVIPSHAYQDGETQKRYVLMSVIPFPLFAYIKDFYVA